MAAAGTPESRIVVFGFSQGGYVSLRTGGTDPLHASGNALRSHVQNPRCLHADRTREFAGGHAADRQIEWSPTHQTFAALQPFVSAPLAQWPICLLILNKTTTSAIALLSSDVPGCHESQVRPVMKTKPHSTLVATNASFSRIHPVLRFHTGDLHPQLIGQRPQM